MLQIDLFFKGFGTTRFKVGKEWVEIGKMMRYFRRKVSRCWVRIEKTNYFLGKENFVASLATKRYAGQEVFKKNPDAVVEAWIRSREVEGHNRKRVIEVNLKRYKEATNRIEAIKAPCIKVRYTGQVWLRHPTLRARSRGSRSARCERRPRRPARPASTGARAARR